MTGFSRCWEGDSETFKFYSVSDCPWKIRRMASTKPKNSTNWERSDQPKRWGKRSEATTSTVSLMKPEGIHQMLGVWNKKRVGQSPTYFCFWSGKERVKRARLILILRYVSLTAHFGLVRHATNPIGMSFHKFSKVVFGAFYLQNALFFSTFFTLFWKKGIIRVTKKPT